MTLYNNQQCADVYAPPPAPSQEGCFIAPVPVGYPVKNGHHDQPLLVSETMKRGFGKGCATNGVSRSSRRQWISCGDSDVLRGVFVYNMGSCLLYFSMCFSFCSDTEGIF
ncbi:hypothetical protein M5689_020154 [Euphorbia peplus]|nr:hypothetical protein M5689_020154 [Euphorbia peplus]